MYIKYRKSPYMQVGQLYSNEFYHSSNTNEWIRIYSRGIFICPGDHPNHADRDYRRFVKEYLDCHIVEPARIWKW